MLSEAITLQIRTLMTCLDGSRNDTQSEDACAAGARSPLSVNFASRWPSLSDALTPTRFRTMSISQTTPFACRAAYYEQHVQLRGSSASTRRSEH